MPIKVNDNLPAKKILIEEDIFVMDETRAFHQDIRPLKIAILNLMPNKQITEVQLLRLLGNTPLQVEITLLHTMTHNSKNTSLEYLLTFYKVFPEIERQHFDGMIITGAPIELLEYEEVTYWEELKTIMDWTRTNVTSTFHICWGAQAALYHHYDIPKYKLPDKMFGVFSHKRIDKNIKLLRGFDDKFYVPHSRHTEIKRDDILKIDNLEILSESRDAGIYLVASKDGKQIFVTGHSEYDPDTLKHEYFRDIKKGLEILIPKHYFKDDDPDNEPVVRWRSHSSLLFSNWLNYYVYQETPYQF